MDLEAAGVQLRGNKLWGLAGAISRLGRARQWDDALKLLGRCSGIQVKLLQQGNLIIYYLPTLR